MSARCCCWVHVPGRCLQCPIHGIDPPRGQATLPAALAGLVLAVGLMLAVGWVEDHSAAGARLLARVSTAVANLIESP